MSDKMKYIVNIVLTSIMILGISIYGFTSEDSKYSNSERRVLAKFPELSISTVFDKSFMTDFETYTQDQFPFRDQFRALKTYAVLYGLNQKENNDLYIKDGYISKLDYPLKQEILDYATTKFQNIHEKFLKDTECSSYFTIIPDKNYFLAPGTHLHYDYDYMMDYMKSSNSNMQYIDICDKLDIADYYFTDTHWRQEKIQDVADYIAYNMGVELDETYDIHQSIIPFKGVYLGQIAIPFKPDNLRWVESDIFDNCTVTSYDTGKPVTKQIYDMDKLSGRDPYEMFMSGSDALIVIENPNASTDKELIIFRDSFGSSISHYFIEAYSKITLVDIRYIQSDMLGTFIDFSNQDVLFMYSTMMLNNSKGFK